MTLSMLSMKCGVVENRWRWFLTVGNRDQNLCVFFEQGIHGLNHLVSVIFGNDRHILILLLSF